MSTNGLSTAASAARFAMNPSPLGAASLVGGAVLGGKGGNGILWEPKFRVQDGQYQYSDTRNRPWIPLPENVMTANKLDLNPFIKPFQSPNPMGTMPVGYQRLPDGSLMTGANTRNPTLHRINEYTTPSAHHFNTLLNESRKYVKENPGGTFGPAGSIRYAPKYDASTIKWK